MIVRNAIPSTKPSTDISSVEESRPSVTDTFDPLSVSSKFFETPSVTLIPCQHGVSVSART